MNKYKINYSVTIEAETQQDAVNIFFDGVPQNGVMQCSVSPEGETIYDTIKDMANDQKKHCVDDLVERMKNLHENINQMRGDVRRYSDIVEPAEKVEKLYKSIDELICDVRKQNHFMKHLYMVAEPKYCIND